MVAVVSAVAAVALLVAVVAAWRAPSGKPSGVLARAAAPMFLAALAAVFTGSALLEVFEDPRWFFAPLGLGTFLTLVGLFVVFTGRPSVVVPPPVRGAPGVATIVDAWSAGDTGDRGVQTSVVRGGLSAAVVMVLVGGTAVVLLAPRPTGLDPNVRLEDGRFLRVSYATCNARAYVRTEENAERAAVSVWTRLNTRNDCRDASTIVLDEPLNGRDVTDLHGDQQLFVDRVPADTSP